MDTKTTLPVSEARKRIFNIIDDIQKPNRYYTLTERGRVKAVIMSAQEFESWRETLEVARDFPDLKKDIKKAEAEYKKGDYISLDELLAKEGYVLADKRKYEISTRIAKKGSKRTGKNR